MIQFDFSDKVVLVTGASAGIGFATARRFLECGSCVMLNGSRPEKLEHALARLGPLREKAGVYSADVGNKAQVEAMFRALAERWGRIDILVNNAGVSRHALLVDMPEELWDHSMDTNLKGMFLTTQQAARMMIARGKGGKIVNISSVSWQVARVTAAAYCASKAGVLMLTKCAAQELSPYGINVNCVAPGLIDVPHEPAAGGFPAYARATIEQTPCGRLGKPEEIAGMVMILCSSETEYVTGAVVGVDGGLTAGRYGIPLADLR